MTQESTLFISIGKQIKDEYGRAVGRVISFAVNPSGRVDSAYIEQGDGKIVKYPAESLKVDGSDVILLSAVKLKATAFCDQIPLIWRKNQAIRRLVDENKISPEVYQDLHESFEGVLNQLKSEAQTQVEEIEKETARCTREIKELNYALVNLEIEHEIGKIDDGPYQTAFATIQECLKKTNAEKENLESTKNKLSNLLLGETLPQSEREAEEEPTEELEAQGETPTPSSSLPEPPVTVYVKEVSESSA